MPETAPPQTPALPYKLACLCDLRDQNGRILLLRRLKEPNKGLCSPIGGKLDMATGESPAQCAQREILEEAGLEIPIDRLHLMGLISEAAFDNGGAGGPGHPGNRGHWLLFYYRVLGPVWVEPHDIREGRLDWYSPDEIDALPLPQTDRTIIWPTVKRHEPQRPGEKPGFFTIHIDCSGAAMRATVEQSSLGPAR